MKKWNWIFFLSYSLDSESLLLDTAKGFDIMFYVIFTTFILNSFAFGLVVQLHNGYLILFEKKKIVGEFLLKKGLNTTFYLHNSTLWLSIWCKAGGFILQWISSICERICWSGGMCYTAASPASFCFVQFMFFSLSYLMDLQPQANMRIIAKMPAG